MKVNQKVAVVGLSLAALAGSASAAIDTASVTTSLTEGGVAVAAVGAAVLVVRVGGKVWKYISAAL